MSDDNGNDHAVQSGPSVLILEFAAPGSAEFSMKATNVTPAQLFAAAGWLDYQARKAFDGIAAAQAKAPKLMIPRL